MKCACESKDRLFYMKKDGIDIYKCPSCGIYISDITVQDPGASDSSKYLAEYKNAYLKARLKAFREYISVIKRYKSSGELLEIGSGMGYFLFLAKESGYKAIGIDSAQVLVEHSKTVLGLTAITADVKNLDKIFRPSNFDVVVMLDVFEHFRDPFDVAASIRGILKEGGILFVKLPDAEILGKHYPNPILEMFRKVYIRCLFPLYPRSHAYHYTAKSLGVLLKKNGLEVLESKGFTNPAFIPASTRGVFVSLIKMCMYMFASKFKFSRDMYVVAVKR